MKLTLICLLAVIMTGCQQRMVTPAGELPDTVAALNNWNLSGRMGYRAGNEGGSASIDWRQRQDRGELRFSGPVGIGSAQLFWAPGEASLETGRDEVRAHSTAELAWRLTGLWLPMEALEFWIRGLPWPDAEWQETRNGDNQLSRLVQLGWTLEFSDYKSDYQPGARLQLPHRIRAEHQDQRFTLVVRRWEPLP